MDFNILAEVIVIMGVIAVGYGSRRLRVIGESTVSGMSNLLVKVINPLLLVGSTQTVLEGENLQRAWTMLLLSLAFHVGVCLLMLLLGKAMGLEERMRKAFAMLIAFGNVGFVGFPLAMALYGDMGLLYAIPVSVGFQAVFWTLGVVVFGGREKLHIKNLLMPGTIASLYVMACMAFPFLRLPDLLTDIAAMVGDMTVPMALFLVGAMLAGANFAVVFKNYLSYLISFIKLIALPLFAFFLLRAMGLDDTTVVLFSVLMACPTGSLVPIMAAVNDCEPQFAAAVTAFNTLLFMGTMPLLLLLFL